jgi:hypothetical protein
MSESKSSGRSFQDTLGRLYQRWVLDCVVSSAVAVSKDFSDRPNLYQDVDDNVADDLVSLQGRYGFDPNYPNDQVRKTLMRPLFGLSDGRAFEDESSAFHETRAAVIEAARAFSENAQATGLRMLRERFLSALVPFRTYLSDREGVSFNKTEERMARLFAFSERVLRDKNVHVVFGINKDVKVGWPLDSTDPNGAKLIEKIVLQFPDLIQEQISLDRFVRLQRIASNGYESIVGLFDPNLATDNDTVDALIARFYAWGSDLGILARS